MALKYVAAVMGLLLAAAPASRAASFDATFLNSNLTFAGATFDHYGYDLDLLRIDGVDYASDFEGLEFTASGGALVQTTSVLDANGTLIRTQYVYEGGTFSLEGLFTAPIVSLLVDAYEPLRPYGEGFGASGVLAEYRLGPGAFDDTLANLLGIQKATGLGLGDASLLLLFGTHQSPQLVADDGLIEFWVDPPAVPEPSLSVLTALGLLAAIRERRRRSRSRRT